MLINQILFASLGAFAQGKECPPGEIYVSSHTRAPHLREGTPVAGSEVLEYCRAKSKAAEYWAKRFSNEAVIGWPHKDEKAKPWKRSEIERVLRELDRLPRWFWTDVKLYRMDKSTVRDNPGTSAPKAIVLYDASLSSPRLQRVLVHEILHLKFDQLEPIHRTAFLVAAEWEATHAGFILRRKKMVAEDSDQSPTEDFANSVEYYLFEPANLKLKTPRIYDWIHLELGDKIRLRRSK